MAVLVASANNVLDSLSFAVSSASYAIARVATPRFASYPLAKARTIRPRILPPHSSPCTALLSFGREHHDEHPDQLRRVRSASYPRRRMHGGNPSLAHHHEQPFPQNAPPHELGSPGVARPRSLSAPVAPVPEFVSASPGPAAPCAPLRQTRNTVTPGTAGGVLASQDQLHTSPRALGVQNSAWSRAYSPPFDRIHHCRTKVTVINHFASVSLCSAIRLFHVA
jgi:hypothetical protein